MLLVSVFLCLLSLYVFGCFVIRAPRKASLWGCKLAGLSAYPKVSVVIATRNEERHLEAALQSVLGLAYPAYEVLVVDDRSEDQTPVILARLCEKFPQLKVLRIDSLPAGWLGKTHALHVGARQTDGEFVLFTDADVVFEESCLRRAVEFVVHRGFDHLSLWPLFYSRSRFLDGFIAFFGYGLALYVRPWEISNPKSSASLGIGAFNLMRRSVLESIGGLSAISLRPDDDIQLGWRIKGAGFRQESLSAVGILKVEWYAHWKECVAGLEKNMFAGFNYNVPFWISMVAFFAFAHLGPFLLLPFAEGASQILLGLTCLLLMISLASSARMSGGRPWYGLLYPLWAFLEFYIFVRNPMKNLIDGGIRWRDTFYSLKELRTQKAQPPPRFKSRRNE